MIFDSVLMGAIAAEIRALRDPTVRDIWQSSAENGGDERAIFLQFREATLLIDTHPQRARLHFVTPDFVTKNHKSSTRNATSAPQTPSVQTPSALTQTLRKTLRRARLMQIVQPNFDRVLRLDFAVRDDIGQSLSYSLVAEIMERRSNAILLDADGVIIDAVKRLPPFLNRARTILPHRTYELPPVDNKENPLLVKNWRDRVLEAPFGSENFSFVLWLRANFVGVSPLAARAIESEIARQNATNTVEKWAPIVAEFWRKSYEAARGANAKIANAKIAFLCGDQPYPFALDESCEARAQSLSELLEAAAQYEESAQNFIEERAALVSFLAKREKSNAAQRADLERAKLHAHDAERFKNAGQLMLSRLSEIEIALGEGRKTLGLRDENAAIFNVDLEPDWSAADNAQRYFNRYRRARKMAGDAPERERVLDLERAQLETWHEAAKNAQNESELKEVADACDWQRGEKTKTVSRTRQQEESARPESKLRQREIDGWRVWMGRSALENQILLSKLASPSDIWLHVRDAPSAHVLIKNQRGKTPPPAVIEEAARWLANVSRRGQSGETLEIIHTPAKWVRAIKGAPGRVALNRFETLLIST